ncbi:MAG: SDR family oxidoreductase, partial [bacterium]|nr:SDR family oxidoreductase [bacterium]
MKSNRPTALVTGAGTGVGRACALRFARAGFNVVINFSRSEADAEQTLAGVRAEGVECFTHRCDVSCEPDVIEMLARIQAEFGRLDVLVNNAATTYFIDFDDLDGLSEDKWDQILAVNTKGTYFCIKAARSMLMADEGGAIVNVSSVAGLTG